ncbi:hypothetical protein F3H11_35820, partial [Pseudomonas aeruginosa]
LPCTTMEKTPTETAQIVDLLQEGLSQRVVTRRLHISQSCVLKAYKRFQETGGFISRLRSGRRRCTSERDDRFIVPTPLRNRYLHGVDVQQELRDIRGVAASEWTLCRRLK